MVDYENSDDLPDEKLLSIPAERLPALSRVWSVRASAAHMKDMLELAAERSGNARPKMLFHDRDPRARHREEEERRRALLAYQAAMEEVRDHAASIDSAAWCERHHQDDGSCRIILGPHR